MYIFMRGDCWWLKSIAKGEDEELSLAMRGGDEKYSKGYEREKTRLRTALLYIGYQASMVTFVLILRVVAVQRGYLFLILVAQRTRLRSSTIPHACYSNIKRKSLFLAIPTPSQTSIIQHTLESCNSIYTPQLPFCRLYTLFSFFFFYYSSESKSHVTSVEITSTNASRLKLNLFTVRHTVKKKVYIRFDPFTPPHFILYSACTLVVQWNVKPIDLLLPGWTDLKGFKSIWLHANITF